jgi:aarF domain-containing kinase
VLEFQKLLDKTDPVPTSAIVETIQQELGQRAFSEVFSYFDSTPLASASVAQVHLARLRTGEEVAVKVLKPGVEDTLKADLGFIYLSTRVLETVAPELGAASIADITADIRTAILDEVDFTKELANMKEFRAFLSKAGISEATCPRPFE